MSDYFPAELIEEILLGLPAKSLLRFRSVCKTWYSLISNSRFANAYLARSNQRSSPYFLFEHHESGKERISLHGNPATDSSDFIEFDRPYDAGGIWLWTVIYKIVGSVNGLICLVDSHQYLHGEYFLWNPSINRAVRLPSINLDNSQYVYCHGFGYHAPTNDYKVVRIRHLDGDTPLAEIYALNTREWHRFSFPPSASFTVQHASVSVSMNGALHWLAQNYLTQENAYHNFILSFDLGDEIIYHEVPVPKVLQRESGQYSLERGRIAMLNGLLALHGVFNNYGYQAKKHDVWVMKDYGVVDSWTKLYAIDFGERLGRVIGRLGSVIGFKKNGEVLILTSYDRNLNYRNLLLYEPKSKRILWYLKKNGLESCFYLDNYVESLVLFDAVDGSYEQDKYDVKVERALKIRKIHNS